ncbi:UBX domain-containing protein 10 [Pleuronectes platessa]|uniref:UBX domain-containing protein 10 n=1 Tax=Pleuronectes platessa TaxID=8262 RepID=UPI00232A3FE2|nr:UBX domain-containing protein 10 [Pleuronectes platessa]
MQKLIQDQGPHSPTEGPKTSRHYSGFSKPSQDEVLHMLQQLPAIPPHSLNKLKVLPPIERRRSEESPGGGLDRSVQGLCDETVPQQRGTSGSEGDDRADVSLRMWPNTSDPEPLGASVGLLLAVRAPCGRRFQQHFESTDALLAVKHSAEARFTETYGEVSIETMDVPRRSFTDMNMTLAQSGIMNRSVLCITRSNNDSVELHD